MSEGRRSRWGACSHQKRRDPRNGLPGPVLRKCPPSRNPAHTVRARADGSMERKDSKSIRVLTEPRSMPLTRSFKKGARKCKPGVRRGSLYLVPMISAPISAQVLRSRDIAPGALKKVGKEASPEKETVAGAFPSGGARAIWQQQFSWWQGN